MSISGANMYILGANMYT